MTRIIAVANQKGGVGKTTTSISLAACLAEGRKKTLLVDLDAQGNATSGLGIDKSSLERCLYDVLINHTELEEIIQPTAWKDLWVAPATMKPGRRGNRSDREKESPQCPEKTSVQNKGQLRLCNHRLSPFSQPADRQCPDGGGQRADPHPV